MTVPEQPFAALFAEYATECHRPAEDVVERALALEWAWREGDEAEELFRPATGEVGADGANPTVRLDSGRLDALLKTFGEAMIAESIALVSRQNLVAVEQMSGAARGLAGESESLRGQVESFQT